MRRTALVIAALVAGCNGSKDEVVVDTDTDVVDTEVVDTDTNHVPEMDFEIDPSKTQIFDATLAVGDKEEHGDLTEQLAYRVAKIPNLGYFRHYVGSVEIENPNDNGPASVTLVVDVVVPNDTVSEGEHDCRGPDSGYAVAIALKAGTVSTALSSTELTGGGDQPCAIDIDTVNNQRFTASIDAATVIGVQNAALVATLKGVTIDLRLRPRTP